MNLEVRKYRSKDEIIINCFDTWSNSIKDLIRDNYEIIEKFREKEKEIFDLKEQYKRENKIYKMFKSFNLDHFWSFSLKFNLVPSSKA